MPWQTPEYYAAQKKSSIRPGTYLRLHENRWAAAEETFITPEMWDPCVNQLHRPSITTRDPLFVGVDVGIKHDNAARVAVKWDEAGERLILVSHRIWKPTPIQPLNLEDTVEQDLRDLNDRNQRGRDPRRPLPDAPIDHDVAGRGRARSVSFRRRKPTARSWAKRSSICSPG